MSGEELLKLVPDAIGFFIVEGMPGIITKDHQGWLFEDGTIIPIPKSDVLGRGGHQVLADEAAEFISGTPGATEILAERKKNLEKSSGQEKPKGVKPKQP
jgi:hypothetical protein